MREGEKWKRTGKADETVKSSRNRGDGVGKVDREKAIDWKRMRGEQQGQGERGRGSWKRSDSLRALLNSV